MFNSLVEVAEYIEEIAKTLDEEIMPQDDTWFRCTVCGREGRVGRCCGDETRIPMNELARLEMEKKEVENGLI